MDCAGSQVYVQKKGDIIEEQKDNATKSETADASSNSNTEGSQGTFVKSIEQSSTKSKSKSRTAEHVNKPDLNVVLGNVLSVVDKLISDRAMEDVDSTHKVFLKDVIDKLDAEYGLSWRLAMQGGRRFRSIIKNEPFSDYLSLSELPGGRGDR